MTKEFFMDSMNRFKNFEKYEGDLYDLGLNIWERDEVALFKSQYLDMLCKLCKDEFYNENRCECNNIEYFIYELEWGQKWAPGMVIEDGQDISMATLDDLWIYLVNKHPEIEDK